MTEHMSIADIYATTDSAMAKSITVNTADQPISDEPAKEQAGPSNTNRTNCNRDNRDRRDDRGYQDNRDNRKRGGAMSDEQYVVATAEGN